MQQNPSNSWREKNHAHNDIPNSSTIWSKVQDYRGIVRSHNCCKPGVIEETTGNKDAAENKVECSLEQGLIVGIIGWGCCHQPEQRTRNANDYYPCCDLKNTWWCPSYVHTLLLLAYFASDDAPTYHNRRLPGLFLQSKPLLFASGAFHFLKRASGGIFTCIGVL